MRSTACVNETCACTVCEYGMDWDGLGSDVHISRSAAFYKKVEVCDGEITMQADACAGAVCFTSINQPTTNGRHDATQRDATRRDATQSDTTQHNATQRNATQRNAARRDSIRRNVKRCEAMRRGSTALALELACLCSTRPHRVNKIYRPQ